MATLAVLWEMTWGRAGAEAELAKKLFWSSGSGVLAAQMSVLLMGVVICGQIKDVF